MPYIIMKRSDIPAGLLQITDLQPNTSLRNPITDPAGQSGYRRAVQNETPVLNNNGGVITFRNACAGLAAWFLTNIADGDEVAATGTITTVPAADLLDNETFSITDAPNPALVFAFNVTGAGYVAVPGEVEVDVTAALTADDVRDAVISAINGATHPATFRVTAADGGAATVDVENVAAGTAGNVAITDTVADAGFTHTGMAGGTDANALTVAEALTNATDVLDLLGYDDGGTAAGSITLAAINGALTTGAISSDQVEEILHILAGEAYAVPAGVQVEAASAFDVSPAVSTAGGPGFEAGSLRDIYETGALRASLDVGILSRLAAATFTFGGVAGAALAVYNDDGTLFVAGG